MSLVQSSSARAVRRLVLGALNACEVKEGDSGAMAPALWDLAVDAQGSLTWEGCRLGDLARRYGTPLHVVSHAQLEKAWRCFHGAFASQYPRVSVAYSYKTNPLPAVLRALHDLGADAEVISHYELWLALQLGVPPERIIFNGPAKTPEALDLAVERGIKLINVDGEGEIPLIEASARRHRRRQQVGVRIVTSVGWSGQFGFRLADGSALAAFRTMLSCEHLDPCAIHLHLGTGVSDPELYFQASREAFVFASRLRREAGIEVRYFDLGGGFGVPTVRALSSMEQRYLDQGLPVRTPQAGDVPAAELYAKGIIALAREYLEGEGTAPPEIILEPGRALTSSAQCLLLSILSTKVGQDGIRFAIADGGRNLTVPLAYEYHALFAADRMHEAARSRHTICGPLCHPSDIVVAQRDLPELAAGDVVATMDSGAYFIPNQTNFSNPRPGAVMIEAGVPRLIRRREQFPDLMRLDELRD